MFKLTMVLLMALLVFGCEVSVDSTPTNAEYTCTEEQLELLKKQVEICMNARLRGSYCYSTAKEELCAVVKTNAIDSNYQ